MTKENMVTREFRFIKEGDQKEIRHYQDEKLVARYSMVLDEDGKVIGVRQLKPESVAPASLLEKVKKTLFARPEPQADYLNWIGVINLIETINTINTINTIKSIEDIESIGSIKDIAWSTNTLCDGDLFISAGTHDFVTPSAGKKIRLKFACWLAYGSVNDGTCYFSFPTSGKFVLYGRHLKDLKRTIMMANLVGCNLEGQADEKLQFYVGASSIDVMVHVIYDEV